MSSLCSYKKFLIPLDTFQGAGEPIHFDYSYTSIREARREDDTQLSQGVWKTKIKLAQWDDVEKLCSDTLINRSKDLQVCCWLIEAWVSKNYLQGVLQGFSFLKLFCDKFWPILYPNTLSIHLDDGLIDQNDINITLLNTQNIKIHNEDDFKIVADRRQNILDWLDKALYRRLLQLPLTPINEYDDKSPLLLHQWIDATDIDKQQRVNQNFNKSLNKITLDECRTHLKSAPQEFIAILRQQTLSCIDALKELNDLFSMFDLPNSAQFTLVNKRMNDILRIVDSVFIKTNSAISQNHTDLNVYLDYINIHKKDNTVIAESQSMSIHSKRDAIYRSLEKISLTLHEIDPHSPAPQLIDLIIAWENKSLLQIMDDITTGESEAHALIRTLSLSYHDKKSIHT